MRIDRVFEARFIFFNPTAGGGPWQCTTHWVWDPFGTPPVAPNQGDVDKAVETLVAGWDQHLKSVCSAGIGSVDVEVSLLVDDVLYQAGDSLPKGTKSGNMMTGGASARMSFSTTRRQGQRAGGVYWPGMHQTEVDNLNGNLMATTRTNLVNAWDGMRQLTVSGMPSERLNLVVVHRIPTQNQYEARVVESVSVAPRATFYDSRYN